MLLRSHSLPNVYCGKINTFHLLNLLTWNEVKICTRDAPRHVKLIHDVVDEVDSNLIT